MGNQLERNQFLREKFIKGVLELVFHCLTIADAAICAVAAVLLLHWLVAGPFATLIEHGGYA